MDFNLWKNPKMDIKKVISDNLSEWMAKTPDLDTLKKLSAKSKIGFGTIRRTKNGEGNVTVENLQEIAKAFGKSPADLLAERKQTTKYELATLPPAIHKVAEPPPEEHRLIEGYRTADAKDKELLLLIATRALDAFKTRSEQKN